MDLNKVYQKSSKIVARRSGDEYILVPIKDNIADMKAVYTLNNTAATIWDKIDGSKTVEELALELAKEFEVDIETSLTDVVELLDDLSEYLIVSE